MINDWVVYKQTKKESSFSDFVFQKVVHARKNVSALSNLHAFKIEMPLVSYFILSSFLFVDMI